MAKCPRCDGMLRAVLVTTCTGTRTAVEACLEGCAGIWVGREDLEAGLRPAMSQALLEVQRGAAAAATRWDFLEVERARRSGLRVVLTPAQLEADIRCVRCGKPMHRYRWNMTSRVVLDECPDGHGIWIDAGEVMQMRQVLEADCADDAVREDIRARLAGVKVEYEHQVRRDARRDSPLGWLFGVLFGPDW